MFMKFTWLTSTVKLSSIRNRVSSLRMWNRCLSRNSLSLSNRSCLSLSNFFFLAANRDSISHSNWSICYENTSMLETKKATTKSSYYLNVEVFDGSIKPLTNVFSFFLGRIQFLSCTQAFLGICFRLCFSFNNFEPLHLLNETSGLKILLSESVEKTYSFNELSVFHKLAFVFDLSRLDPGFDLVSKPLKLFDLLLKISFILFFLIAICCIVNLLPNVLK